MFWNYLKVAWRNLLRHPLYTAINIVGLAVGLAFCALTILYVRHEWSYDSFHKHANSVFRLYVCWKDPGGDRRFFASQSPPLAPVLAENIPEIVHTARLKSSRKWMRVGEKMFEQDLLFADASLFDIFSFPLRLGDESTALLDKNSVVLQEDLAQRYFGNENAVGKQIAILGSGNRFHHFLVTGVAHRIPANSSIRFDCLLPYERLIDILEIDIHSRSTAIGNHTVYVRLAENSVPAEVEAKFPSVVKKYTWNPERKTLHLQRLTDVHHANHVLFGPEPASNPVYSYVLSGLALLVLLIACVNFVNLSISRSAARAKELGVRKVIGARRNEVAVQIWSESLILSFIALLLGFAIAELFLPMFNDLIQKIPPIEFQMDGWTLGILAGLTLLVSLAAGGYPAALLSRFHPVDVLKKTLRISGRGGLGQMLMVIQYALSIFFIVSAILMTKQVEFLKMKSLGSHSEPVLVVPLWKLERAGAFEVFKNELAQHEYITGITGASDLFGWGLKRYTTLYKDKKVSFGMYEVDRNYFDFMGVKLVSGRGFSDEFGVEGVMVNETWVNTIGLDASEHMKGVFEDRPIVGVVKDFHYQSLHHGIEPVMFSHTSSPSYMFVKIRADDIPTTIELLKNKWNLLVPNLPFDFEFLDAHVDRLYKSDQRWGQIVGYSSLFAILIASLGAFGLTALAVARRAKEVGIRKALGASVLDIILLFSKDFIKFLILANLIGWPMAYYIMSRWLQDFAYRINVAPQVFVLGGFITFVIVLLTATTQAYKAATANPVDALRYE